MWEAGESTRVVSVGLAKMLLSNASLSSPQPRNRAGTGSCSERLPLHRRLAGEDEHGKGQSSVGYYKKAR